MDEMKPFLLLIVAIPGFLFAQMSSEKEVSLGHRMAVEMETHQKMIGDAEVQAFADRVLNKLSRRMALRVPLEVKVIDRADIDVASTMPGGILLVSTGAILRAESEAEFSALIAHAMGHSQIGPVTSPGQLAGNEIPLIFWGGPWGSCNRSSDGSAGTSLMPKRAVQAELSEAQADLLALGYLVNGGYDPHALASVFEHWSGKLRPDEGIKDRSNALVKIMPNPIVNTSAFDQIKARLYK